MGSVNNEFIDKYSDVLYKFAEKVTSRYSQDTLIPMPPWMSGAINDIRPALGLIIWKEGGVHEEDRERIKKEFSGFSTSLNLIIAYYSVRNLTGQPLESQLLSKMETLTNRIKVNMPRLDGGANQTRCKRCGGIRLMQ